jgi:uncharacterized membrane protein
MSGFAKFVRATIVGGLLFLVPLILIVVVLQKGLGMVRKMVVPIASQLPVSRIAGVGVATILAVLLIVLVSFVFGLAVRTRLGRRVRDSLEYAIMGKVPGYAMVKGVLQGASGLESEDEPQAALIRIEDAWQIGFVTEVHPDGHRTVYVPGAPNPSSGSIFYLTEDRIRPIDAKLPVVVRAIRHHGIGSRELLKGKLET